MKQRIHKDRNQDAIHKAKQENDMKMPVNQYLNAKNENGQLKYASSEKIRRYYFANLDPILNAMRLSNSLIHELRWHRDRSSAYFNAFHSKDRIEETDKFGKQMSRDECYTAHIAESHTCHIVLSKLREHLLQGLLPLVSVDVFSLDQYDLYITRATIVIEEIGFELFPEKLELIYPK